RPATESVALAFATDTPAVGLLIVAVHIPFASVAPLPVVPLAAPQDPPVSCAVAPLEFAIDVVTAAPAAGPKPVALSPPGAPAGRPSSFWTVTVNVWLVRTSFVLSGAIVIRASTTCSGSQGPSEGVYSRSPR